MTSMINTIPTQSEAVIADFGWYYGLSPTRLPEDVYVINGITYPPGRGTLGGTGSLTLPASTIPTNFANLRAMKTEFEATGTIVLNNYISSHTTVMYTGLAIVGGFPSFTGCTGGSGTFTVGTPIYDPRFYVDQMPLGDLITFDAVDHEGLGLPVTVAPAGVNVVNYQWNFGNGEIGYGTFASTTYIYNQPPPAIQATLTVTDSLGRTASVAHRLNLVALASIFGTALRERQSNAGYR